jgi:hypothetical protein
MNSSHCGTGDSSVAQSHCALRERTRSARIAQFCSNNSFAYHTCVSSGGRGVSPLPKKPHCIFSLNRVATSNSVGETAFELPYAVPVSSVGGFLGRASTWEG